MRPAARRLLLGGLAVGLVAVFVALGIWQVERRAWKLALIAQVEHRLAAGPVAAPGPARWPAIGTGDAYTKVALRGHWHRDADTFTQAATTLGPGFWVMTPLDSDAGFTVLVNRGFVPAERRAMVAPPPGPVTVVGLLRVTEPRGGFLRDNVPAEDRWYSRDVAAIAAHRHIARIAPYFVDADAASSPGWPRGGLTVVRFRNSHLSYALTWFALAALLAGTLVWLARRRTIDGDGTA
jgi:surfeit locus 1 family protein